MVETTLVGVVMNGLSHLHNIKSKEHFACSLIKGLGSNLDEERREKFAKEVYNMMQVRPPDSKSLLDVYFDEKSGALSIYSGAVSSSLSSISLIIAITLVASPISKHF